MQPQTTTQQVLDASTRYVYDLTAGKVVSVSSQELQPITNWLVRTSGADYFLKQYPPRADIAGEAAALELSQEARAAGLPVPLVNPASFSNSAA